MGSTLKLFFVLSQTLFLSSQFSKASDYNNLVYKNCSSQTLAGSNESQSKSLHSLFQELVPQSSKSKFFKATAGDDPSAAVSGFFQCRGDLSNKDCFDCVNTLPDLSNSLCNKSVAGRIQLHGCYFYYETDEFIVDDETSKQDLIHKVCGQKAKDSSFEGQRDKAFEAMVSGVIEGKGFFSGEYASVHATAQCEGDLIDCDCGECVSNAVQIAQEECVGSVSGQIYLDRCFISYSYFPQGSGASTNSDNKKNKGGGGDSSNTGKTVAIVLGGVAALALGFIFLSFLRSCGDKDSIWRCGGRSNGLRRVLRLWGRRASGSIIQKKNWRLLSTKRFLKSYSSTMDRERAVRAVNAMKAIGIVDKQVKTVLLNLLELFNWNWEYIEAEDYRALKDRYFDFRENQGVEDENECVMGQDSLERPSKRLHLGQQKDHVSSAMANSSKTLALKEAEMPMPTSGQGSKKPSQLCLTDIRRGSSSQIPNALKEAEMPMPTSGQGSKKPSQLCLTDIRRGSSSQITNAQVSCKRKDLTSSHLAFRERKSTHNGESQAVYLKQPLDKHGSSRSLKENSATSHCSRKSIKTKAGQPISSVSHHAEPISVVCPAGPGSSAGSSSGKHLVKSLASQHKRTANEDDASVSNDSASSNNNFSIASSAMGEVKMFLNCTPAFERPNFQSPNFDAVLKHLEFKNLVSGNVKPQFSVKKLLEDLCDTFLKLGNKSTSGPVAIGSSPEAIINVEDSLSATGLKKQASRVCDSERDLNKKNPNRSNCLNSSNLATAQQRSVICNEKRSICITDIAKGLENVRIPLVDETCNEDLPKFTYIPQNVIYQNAYVHISLARISDEDCCSNCSGDCLSLSIPCACTRETGGEFAYTQQGLLKEEFLSACMSMKKGPCEEHLVYCQDCPIERSNNEYCPEKCKGHIVRKFIKECWRKCGCSMQCRNRIVQQGITCKLQVFLTDRLKGWGLRTLQDLPKGSFVCEYVGEVLTNTELYERNMQSSGSERHTYPVTLDADWGSERVLRDEEALCLDATFCGNVARFINHRCFDANLIDIPVEIETPDRHYYHLAFFTTRDVSASEELTWDYGIDFSDHDHPIKAFHCCCGSEFCRDVK